MALVARARARRPVRSSRITVRCGVKFTRKATSSTASWEVRDFFRFTGRSPRLATSSSTTSQRTDLVVVDQRWAMSPTIVCPSEMTTSRQAAEHLWSGCEHPARRAVDPEHLVADSESAHGAANPMAWGSACPPPGPWSWQGRSAVPAGVWRRLRQVRFRRERGDDACRTGAHRLAGTGRGRSGRTVGQVVMRHARR